MLKMFRLRRYRVFLAFAVIATLLFLRYSPGRWDQFVLSKVAERPLTPSTSESEDAVTPADVAAVPADLKGKVGGSSELSFRTATPTPVTSFEPIFNPPTKVSHRVHVSTSINIAPAPAQTIPPRMRPQGSNTVPEEGAEDDEVTILHPVGQPDNKEVEFLEAPTTIHWHSYTEHFPVPTESVINLPTDVPIIMPMIQHEFDDETSDAKITREQRQKKIVEEFQKSWAGYKKYAWLRDELSPVSGKFRDPFCSWAATLVDSLDTLWIMGLEDEFEEAARAVDKIDFTTTPRNEIPVFETTIRYLGGLIGAYDVSERKYPNLLNKAVELAEILMGAFDTPNRMPVLFYNWKPDFATQPHRASQRSNTAELGSLSMEFTRLAQLTKHDRYYDAVARITDALSEWQDRGTGLDGVFPDNIDASGCNTTIPIWIHEPVNMENATTDTDPPKGFEPSKLNTVKEPKPKKGRTKPGGDLELQIFPGQPGKAIVTDVEQTIRQRKRSLEENDVADEISADATAASVDARDSEESEVESTAVSTTTLTKSSPKVPQVSWDCTPQGLAPSSPYSRGKYSMAGGQDSTYEYFTKQYLLLGGRETKYRKMYTKTMEAVRKWMLYRPMVPGDRDILFSGSVSTAGKPETDLMFRADVEHLTCFIGGMVGMGAKLFGFEGDLDLAKRLADGCVWAYESTASGIMPESATVYACEDAQNCIWNETEYYRSLDPSADHRDAQLKEYQEKKAQWDAEKTKHAQARLSSTSTRETQETDADDEKLPQSGDDAATIENDSSSPASEADKSPATSLHSHQKRQTFADDVKLPKGFSNTPTPDQSVDEGSLSPHFAALPIASDETAANEDLSVKGDSSAKEDSPVKQDSSAKEDLPAGTGSAALEEPLDETKTLSKPVQSEEPVYMDKASQTEAELLSMIAGHQAEYQRPVNAASHHANFADVPPPLSHKDYVKKRIANEHLPTGYTSIRGEAYHLRPEAIESVWYMYRITGDPTWQEKGWKMFEAIIKHTSANHGHSAIFDVTLADTSQSDEMESFWLAETLKYFYLLFSTPDTISLDEWVLNTEAHPFRRDF